MKEDCKVLRKQFHAKLSDAKGTFELHAARGHRAVMTKPGKELAENVAMMWHKESEVLPWLKRYLGHKERSHATPNEYKVSDKWSPISGVVYNIWTATDMTGHDTKPAAPIDTFDTLSSLDSFLLSASPSTAVGRTPAPTCPCDVSNSKLHLFVNPPHKKKQNKGSETRHPFVLPLGGRVAMDDRLVPSFDPAETITAVREMEVVDRVLATGGSGPTATGVAGYKIGGKKMRKLELIKEQARQAAREEFALKKKAHAMKTGRKSLPHTQHETKIVPTIDTHENLPIDLHGPLDHHDIPQAPLKAPSADSSSGERSSYAPSEVDAASTAPPTEYSSEARQSTESSLYVQEGDDEDDDAIFEPEPSPIIEEIAVPPQASPAEATPMEIDEVEEFLPFEPMDEVEEVGVRYSVQNSMDLDKALEEKEKEAEDRVARANMLEERREAERLEEEALQKAKEAAIREAEEAMQKAKDAETAALKQAVEEAAIREAELQEEAIQKAKDAETAALKHAAAEDAASTSSSGERELPSSEPASPARSATPDTVYSSAEEAESSSVEEEMTSAEDSTDMLGLSCPEEDKEATARLALIEAEEQKRVARAKMLEERRAAERLEVETLRMELQTARAEVDSLEAEVRRGGRDVEDADTASLCGTVVSSVVSTDSEVRTLHLLETQLRERREKHAKELQRANKELSTKLTKMASEVQTRGTAVVTQDRALLADLTALKKQVVQGHTELFAELDIMQCEVNTAKAEKKAAVMEMKQISALEAKWKEEAAAAHDRAACVKAEEERAAVEAKRVRTERAALEKRQREAAEARKEDRTDSRVLQSMRKQMESLHSKQDRVKHDLEEMVLKKLRDTKTVQELLRNIAADDSDSDSDLEEAFAKISRRSLSSPPVKAKAVARCSIPETLPSPVLEKVATPTKTPKPYKRRAKKNVVLDDDSCTVASVASTVVPIKPLAEVYAGQADLLSVVSDVSGATTKTQGIDDIILTAPTPRAVKAKQAQRLEDTSSTVVSNSASRADDNDTHDAMTTISTGSARIVYKDLAEVHAVQAAHIEDADTASAVTGTTRLSSLDGIGESTPQRPQRTHRARVSAANSAKISETSSPSVGRTDDACTVVSGHEPRALEEVSAAQAAFLQDDDTRSVVTTASCLPGRQFEKVTEQVELQLGDAPTRLSVVKTPRAGRKRKISEVSEGEPKEEDMAVEVEDTPTQPPAEDASTPVVAEQPLTQPTQQSPENDISTQPSPKVEEEVVPEPPTKKQRKETGKGKGKGKEKKGKKVEKAAPKTPKTPKTPQRTPRGKAETPVETPRATPKETPQATPKETPKDTPKETPVKETPSARATPSTVNRTPSSQSTRKRKRAHSAAEKKDAKKMRKSVSFQVNEAGQVQSQSQSQPSQSSQQTPLKQVIKRDSVLSSAKLSSGLGHRRSTASSRMSAASMGTIPVWKRKMRFVFINVI